MGNGVIHISDAEAANEFASLLDRVRAGAEVVIEHDARPIAVLRRAV
jgi:antitoxin (DNA-binding transcriptional repressor) of toxin-antitoxin stability system